MHNEVEVWASSWQWQDAAAMHMAFFKDYLRLRIKAVRWLAQLIPCHLHSSTGCLIWITAVPWWVSGTRVSGWSRAEPCLTVLGTVSITGCRFRGICIINVRALTAVVMVLYHRPRLLDFGKAPPHLQFNKYVLTGYRPVSTAEECLGSLFYMHNELGNIYTHGKTTHKTYIVIAFK